MSLKEEGSINHFKQKFVCYRFYKYYRICFELKLAGLEALSCQAQFSRWKNSTNYSVNFTASILKFHVSGGLLEILAGLRPLQALSKLGFRKHFSILLEAVREHGWLIWKLLRVLMTLIYAKFCLLREMKTFVAWQFKKKKTVCS